MNSNLAYVNNLAASGTANVVIPLSFPLQTTEIATSAYYTAQAATSGVRVHLTTSQDGTTYAAANGFSDQVALPAVSGTINTVTHTVNSLKIGGGTQKFAKLALTNLDTTNAAAVAINYQTHQ